MKKLNNYSVMLGGVFVLMTALLLILLPAGKASMNNLVKPVAQEVVSNQSVFQTMVSEISSLLSGEEAEDKKDVEQGILQTILGVSLRLK